MTGRCTRWERWLPGSGGRLKVLNWNYKSFQLFRDNSSFGLNILGPLCLWQCFISDGWNRYLPKIKRLKELVWLWMARYSFVINCKHTAQRSLGGRWMVAHRWTFRASLLRSSQEGMGTGREWGWGGTGAYWGNWGRARWLARSFGTLKLKPSTWLPHFSVAER